MSLPWGLPCVSMCHSKSAQLSHSGWGERENKGLEQQGQPWGERRVAPSHKEGKEAPWSGRGATAQGRNPGREAEASPRDSPEEGQGRGGEERYVSQGKAGPK